ncbi:MAG: discoidin domain-containing protein, partial [Bifidobacteriaceae bacterium]|nr:discoidin domain-containing protein [Bifidobacteriaceae bacterium]
FPAGTQARYVRMQGIQGHATYAYSIWEFEAYQGSDPTNLALGKTASASVENTATNETADKAVDGLFTDNGTANDSRWGMPPGPLRVQDAWWQVDFGSTTSFDRLDLYWEGAAGQIYLLQTSNDGVTWQNVASYGLSGVARVDEHVFAPQTARYLRMQGALGHATYGYSIFEIEARNQAATANLALASKGATANASSSSMAITNLNDGSYATRWAVSTGDRPRGDSWAQIDFGQSVTFDRARLFWETAAGQSYLVQVSDNGTDWTTVSRYGFAGLVQSDSPYLTIDDRVSFVRRGTSNPIQVSHSGTVDSIILSAGPAAGSANLLVEGYAKTDAATAASLAARPAVTTSNSALRASDADSFVSVFNLSNTAINGLVSLPQATASRLVYQGVNSLTSSGSDLAISLPSASADVLAPRFELSGSDLFGLTAEVSNGQTVSLSASDSQDHTVTVTGLSFDQSGQIVRQAGNQTVTVTAGQSTTVSLPEQRPYPLVDRAVGRITFPTSPLPSGMSDPDFAVDDDPSTAWTPGRSDGKIVVDLGSSVALGQVRTIWTAIGQVPTARLALSPDGLTWTDAGEINPERIATTAVAGSARYLALQVADWASTSASLASLSIYDTAADPTQVTAELRSQATGPASALDLLRLRVMVNVYDLFDAVPARWTSSTYQVFHAAMTLAHNTLADPQADASVVGRLLAELPGLADGLVEAVNTSVLEALIEQAQAILDTADQYVSANLTALAEALAAAQAVLDASPTQAEADAAATALFNALANVHKLGDKTVLLALIAVADSLTSSQFTPSSWLGLSNTLLTARPVADDPQASQFAVDDATSALEIAFNGLVLRSVKAGLASAISVAQTILGSESLYQPASLVGLAEALASAQIV